MPVNLRSEHVPESGLPVKMQPVLSVTPSAAQSIDDNNPLSLQLVCFKDRPLDVPTSISGDPTVPNSRAYRQREQWASIHVGFGGM